MQDVVERPGYVNVFADVLMIKFKLLQFEKMLDISEVARDQVIHADHMKSFLNKTVAKMGA